MTDETTGDTKAMSELLEEYAKRFDAQLEQIQGMLNPLGERLTTLEKWAAIPAPVALDDSSRHSSGPDGTVENRIAALEKQVNLHKAKLHHM